MAHVKSSSVLSAVECSSDGLYYFPSLNRKQFSDIPYAKAWAQRQPEFEIVEGELNIFIGSDSGNAFSLFEHIQEKSTKICVIEPNQVIADIFLLMRKNNMQNRNFYQSFEEFCSQLKEGGFDSYIISGKINVHVSLAAQSDYLKIYRPLTIDVNRELDQRHRDIKKCIGNISFVKEGIFNARDLNVSAQHLFGKMQGCTAVVAAAGPFLDQMLDWIVSVRDKILLISVSRVSKRLQDYNLVPDIIVSVDPTEASYEVSRHSLLFDPAPLLVCSYHANHRFIAEWHGPITYVGTRLPWPCRINGETCDLPGPTVSNSAVMLAANLGAKKIIFAGIDLTFDQSGHSHAQGSVERTYGNTISPSDLEVQTNTGGMALTNIGYMEAVHSMRIIVAQLSAQIYIANPNPNAFFAEEMHYIPVEQLNDLVGETAAEQWRCVKSDIECQFHDQALKTTVPRLIRARMTSLARFSRLCREAKKISAALKTAPDECWKTLHKRLDIIDNLLRTRFNIDREFCVGAYGATFVGLVEVDDEKYSEVDNTLDKAEKLYHAYSAVSALLVRMLKVSLDQFKTDKFLRKNDLRGFQSLKNMNEIGRLRRYPNAALTHQSALAAWGEELVKDRIGNSRKKDMPLVDRVRPHMEVAYQQSNVKLLDFCKGLVQTDLTQDHAQELLVMIEAYTHELNDDDQLAWEAYSQVYESSHEWIQEESLHRSSELALRLGAINEAVVLLENLLKISGDYAAPFAQLLRIVGATELADEVLEQY